VAVQTGADPSLAAGGIAPTDVMIVLHEPLLDNWGLRGGTPASELDLGFNLKV
jgi:hypothetical protein